LSLSREKLPEEKAPFIVTTQVAGPFKVEAETVRIGPRLQVATHPLGTDAVEIVWQINDLIPHDGEYCRSITAAFVAQGEQRTPKGMTVEVLAGLDGEHFEKIAAVPASQNRHVHANVETGLLHYYKVRALDKDGKVWGESAVTLGAAGPNLLKTGDFEAILLGKCERAEYGDGLRLAPKDFYKIVEGGRPYTKQGRILKFVFQPVERRPIHAYDSYIPLSSGKTYLQGGWFRAPGNVWYGRCFYDGHKEEMCLGYLASAVYKFPHWTFAVQFLKPDEDGTGYRRRPDGRPFGIARKNWTFPKEAAFMSSMIVVYGDGEADDLWVVEARKAE